LSLSPAEKQPEEKGQKESSGELSQVEPAAGQDGVDPIPIFPFQVVAFEPVMRLT
jgi:hypothetical protein